MLNIMNFQSVNHLDIIFWCFGVLLQPRLGLF